MNRDDQSTCFDELLQLLSEHGFDRMPEAIEILMNEAMKLERSEALGAIVYQRSWPALKNDTRRYPSELCGRRWLYVGGAFKREVPSPNLIRRRGATSLATVLTTAETPALIQSSCSLGARGVYLTPAKVLSR